MAARADTASRLAIFELTEDRTRQEGISLVPDADLTIFILSEGPHKRLLVDDLLRDYAYVVIFVILLVLRPMKLLTSSKARV